MTDRVEDLLPGLHVGERVTLVVELPDGPGDVLGFVTALDGDAMSVVTRRGETIAFPRSALVTGRRMPVSRGRSPLSFPFDLLRGLADRAGADGDLYVARISDLLAGRPFPEQVPAWGEWAIIGTTRARFENEWVTLQDASPEVARDAAWWATRQGARSVLVATSDPDVASELVAAGFVRRDS